jgi:hypothetical protein
LVTPTHSSNAPIFGNLLVAPSLTSPATVTATGTSQPTATNTTAPTSPPEAWGKVLGYFVNLRTGPDMNFTVVRKLTHGEPLMFLGRLSENTWLYVKTSDSQEG